jgi:hypothetical protein
MAMTMAMTMTMAMAMAMAMAMDDTRRCRIPVQRLFGVLVT